MKNKKKIIIPIIVAILIIGIILVDAETLISNAGVEYEPAISNALNNSEWVSVGITIYSKNLTIVDNILSQLSPSEFNLSLKLDDGFYGSITKEGFNKIINNLEIKSIYREGNAQIAQNQSKIGNNGGENNKTNLLLIITPIIIILLLIIFYIIFRRKNKKQ